MSADRKNYLLKIRGGVEVDSRGKRAGKGALIAEEISHTLGTSQDQYLFQAVMVENHPADSRVNIDESGTCQTLTSRMGTGGGNVPLVMYSKHRRAKFKGDFETWSESETANTLNTFDQGDVRATDVVVCETFHCNTEVGATPPLKARDWKDPLIIAIDRSTFNQGENAKYDISVSGGGIAYTVVARGPGAVCYPKLSEASAPEITKGLEISS